MRIIGGTSKGRILHPPRNFKARPTTDVARESLFNILQNRTELHTLQILDLFAGAGGISFEFASRGSIHIDAVEIEPTHANYIRQTAAALGFTQIRVIRNDAYKYLRFCTACYDLIFADPPYDHPRVAQIPTLIFERPLLQPAGQLILEHSSNHNFSQHPNFTETRRYGSVNFSFFNTR